MSLMMIMRKKKVESGEDENKDAAMEEELEKEIPMSCFAYKKNKILSQLSPSLVLSVSVSIMVSCF